MLAAFSPLSRQENPGRGTALAQQQLAIANTAADSQASAMALRAWSVTEIRSAFTFENAESIGVDNAARRLFSTLLGACPPTRTLIVCSRSPTWPQSSRFVLPHELMTLGSAELAFNHAETEAVFEDLQLSWSLVDRIEEVARGWPIAIMLFRRLAIEGRLEESLASIEDVVFENLYDYLAGEVLKGLPPDEMDAVIACASLPKATVADAAAALVDADGADLVNRVVASLPFIQLASDGTMDVHPIMRATIRKRYHARSVSLLRSAAIASEDRGEHLRAAMVFVALGDTKRAACLLAALDPMVDRLPTMNYATLLASLDAEAIAPFPNLRLYKTAFNRYQVDPRILRDEIEATWKSLPPDIHPAIRSFASHARALSTLELGRIAEVDAFLCEIETASGGIPAEPQSLPDAILIVNRASVLNRQGRFDEAERHYARCRHVFVDSKPASTSLAIELAIIARGRGDRDAERDHTADAMRHAGESGALFLIAWSLAEAAFGAWLAGEDALLHRLITELDRYVEREGFRGFASLCCAIHSPEIAIMTGIEQPNWRACGRLIAATMLEGRRERVQHAQAAKQAADESGMPFLQVLANVVLAELLPTARERYLATAMKIGATIESTPLHADLAALMCDHGPLTMLGPLAARMRQNATIAREPVHLEILTQRVRYKDRTIDVPDRELALCIALARAMRPVSRAELTQLLWPDRDDDAALEAFSSCLYRLKQRLGDAEVITHTSEGYELAANVRVDLRAIEHISATWSSRSELSAAERSMLRQVNDRLRAARVSALDRWDWAASLRARIIELRRAVSERLARDALRRGQADEAVAAAREMIVEDPCDEAAREVVIRVHLGKGDRASALREYRQLREHLWRDLEVRPSRQLTALLED